MLARPGWPVRLEETRTAAGVAIARPHGIGCAVIAWHAVDVVAVAGLLLSHDSELEH